MKSICLVMIVKNEASQLPRCFSTIKDHIDSWCIVDTGSTDDTIKVIKEELKDIPGHLIKRPWVNFGHNRTESLGFASTKADYLLLCDADEQIIFTPEFDKSQLNADQYMVKYSGALSYRVPYLIKSGLNWSYVGVTHEFLSCDKDVDHINIDSINIIDHGDGGSKSDKFTRDIELLTQDLKVDPTNPRSMFYLANSYKNSHQPHKAIEWYDKRIAKGGWTEEVTCSYLYKGLCQEILNNIQDAIFTFIQGYEHNQNRAECIYNAVRLLRISGKSNVGYHLAKVAKEIPYPHSDILFIENDVYEYKIDYELSVLSYYNNNNEDIRNIFKNLLEHKDVNHQNTISNYKWYCKSIESCEMGRVDFTSQSDTYWTSSPCIFKLDDGYGMNVRQVSYIINQNSGSYEEVNPSITNGRINTSNIFIKLDKDFNEISRHNFLTKDLNEKAVNGIEDIKVIPHNSELFFTGTKWHDYQKIGIVHGKYDINKPYLEYEELPSPEGRLIEKNWVPYISTEDLDYVYDWNPIKTGYVNDDGLLDISTHDKRLPNFRGSSPGFEYDGEIYFLTHIVEYSTPRHYYHSIVVLDAETLEYKRHSNLFTFEGQKIEYGLGLIIEDERVIMSHSVWDRTSQIKIYNKEKLFKRIF